MEINCIGFPLKFQPDCYPVIQSKWRGKGGQQVCAPFPFLCHIRPHAFQHWRSSLQGGWLSLPLFARHLVLEDKILFSSPRPIHPKILFSTSHTLVPLIHSHKRLCSLWKVFYCKKKKVNIHYISNVNQVIQWCRSILNHGGLPPTDAVLLQFYSQMSDPWHGKNVITVLGFPGDDIDHI